LDNVEGCCLDDIPMLMRMGGAGIHFMLIRKRYRASFNFLEHPRVVIAFKKKEGLVACSPKTDPCGMRVSSARLGKEILDERQEAQAGADHQEAA